MPCVVHFELGADDPERVGKFYGEVFGWRIQQWEGPEPYWMVTTGEGSETGIDGGIAKRGDLLAPVVNTIDVPSADEYVEKIAAAGGEVVVPKMAVSGIGYVAYCRDTEGNVFGILEADESAG